jgi:hypothetical protein
MRTVTKSWDITNLKGDRVFESKRGDIPIGEQRQQNLRFQKQYLAVTQGCTTTRSVI